MVKKPIYTCNNLIHKNSIKFILHKAYDHEGNWEGIFEKGKPCTNEKQAERNTQWESNRSN